MIKSMKIKQIKLLKMVTWNVYLDWQFQLKMNMIKY